MKNNKAGLTGFTAVIAIGFVMGCGLLGGSAVPKGQINTDLMSQTIKGNDGTTWDFKEKYASHCFRVKETKENGDSLNLTLEVTTEVVVNQGAQFKVGGGDIVMSYKKDGGKWKLNKLESGELRVRTISSDQAIKEWAPATRPVCAYFSSGLNE